MLPYSPKKKSPNDNEEYSTLYPATNSASASGKSNGALFVSAKVSQFALLPQGKVEATDRVLNMVKQMDLEGFGNCTNTGACHVECPKGIS